jgi:recombination protein RecA
MRFYSSLRIGIHDEWSETKDTDGFAAGRKVKLHIEKNSFGAPHRDAMLSVQFGRGINRVRDLLDCGLELGVIERAGPYYKLTQVDGQGKKIREISGLGEEGFAEKVAPYLDEVRESIRLMVVAKSRKKRELEKKAIQDALQVQEEKREELKKKPPEKLAEVKAEEKK